MMMGNEKRTIFELRNFLRNWKFGIKGKGMVFGEKNRRNARKWTNRHTDGHKSLKLSKKKQNYGEIMTCCSCQTRTFSANSVFSSRHGS